jgi:hypothetical protein
MDFVDVVFVQPCARRVVDGRYKLKRIKELVDGLYILKVASAIVKFLANDDISCLWETKIEIEHVLEHHNYATL